MDLHTSNHKTKILQEILFAKRMYRLAFNYPTHSIDRVVLTFGNGAFFYTDFTSN